MILDYFKIALRSLTRRKLRSWLTLIGIVIGITSVVALIGLGQGLQAAISGIFGNLGTDKITVTAEGGFGPPGTGVNEPLTISNMEDIGGLSGVDRVVGRLVSAGKLEFNKKVGYGYAVSMPQTQEGIDMVVETLNLKIEKGRLLKESDNGKVLVGYEFFNLDEYFGKKIDIGTKIKLQERTFEVVGIADKLGNPIFDSAVYINEDDMREIFELTDDEIHIIAVQVKDEKNIPKIKENIEKYLRKDRDLKEGEEDFSVSTPEDAVESVNSTLGAVNIFVIVIAAISILVGGIGIMNTMFMSVTERTRDIGIMKSIGATNLTIFTLFFIESGLLGSVGGTIGTLLGSLLAMIGSMGLKGFLGGELDVSAQIGPMLVLSSIGGAFIIGSMFGTIPAIKASKLHPVDALRHKK